jgi:hypothetical protein
VAPLTVLRREAFSFPHSFETRLFNGLQWEGRAVIDTGSEEDSLNRGLENYSEYGLHGNGCLAGLRCLVRPERDKSTEVP